MNIWKNKNNFLYLSILLTFLIIAYYHLSKGPIMSLDSNQFSGWADDLIKMNLNLYKYYAQNSFIVSNFFYTVPIIFIAIFKFFFGSEWQNAFLILNLILLFSSLIIFTKSLLILEVRPIVISLTMPILVMSVDLLIWPRYVLSDMIFTFLVILATYVVIKGIIKNKIHYLILFFIMLLILLTRPSSIPIIFGIFSYLVISRLEIYKRPKIILLITLVLFIITPIIFTILYYLIEYTFSDSKQLVFLIEMVKIGMIIHDRPDTWVPSPNTFIDVTNIYFLRLINFFNPYAISFSKIHIILNSFQTFFIFFSLLIWSFIGGNEKSKDKAILFILLLSFSVSAFHSFTLIDYDWRYRFPIILPLLMIFSMTMEIVLKRIGDNRV